MAVTQYIGARYVPLFADPIQWDNQRTYEPLTIVIHEGNSFTSRQAVPVGIDISNDDFWALTGNYNAQVEVYRQETARAVGLANTAQSTANENKDNLTTLTGQLKAGAYRDVDTAPAKNSTNVITSGGVANAIDDITSIDWTGKTIGVFSDSTFQGNIDPRSSVMQKSVVTWLSELSNATVKNYGVGGTQIGYLYDLLTATTKPDLYDADVIIVAYGINNWQGGSELYQINKGYANAFMSVYKNCLSLIAQLYPQAQVVCVTQGYTHSNYSSSDGYLNINVQGLHWAAYNDVVEYCANQYHCATMRLDHLLGINEQNYNRRMVPSGAVGTQYENVWVHYNETTTKQVAQLILSGVYNNGFSSTEIGVDVTPMWNPLAQLADATHIKYNKLYTGTIMTLFQIDHGGTPVTFTSSEFSNDEHWVFAYLSNIVVKCNGRSVCSFNNKSGYCLFPVTPTDNSITIEFSNINESGTGKVGSFHIYRGYPNFFNAMNNYDMNWGGTFSNDNVYGYITYSNGTYDVKLRLLRDVAVNGTTTPMFNLPQPLPAINYLCTGQLSTAGIFTGYFRTYQNAIYNNEPSWAGQTLKSGAIFTGSDMMQFN